MPTGWDTVKLRLQQKLVRTGNTTRITLPRQLLFALGLVPGDVVYIEAENGRLTHFERVDPDLNFPGRAIGVMPETPEVVKR